MKSLKEKRMVYPLIFIFVVFFTGLGSYLSGQTVKRYAVVISSAANIRSAPSTKGEIVYVAKSGERMELLENLGTWIKVKTKTGVEGYVWEKLVRVEVEKIIQPSKPVKEPPQSQPQIAKPAVPVSGVQTTVGKKSSRTAVYLIGGAVVAGAAAYLLFRKGGILNKGTATLKVTSTPSEATVYIDGTEQCTTPCTVENIKPGTHTIKVEKELYGKWEKEMELKGHQEYSINATLAPFKYKLDSCFGSGGNGNGQFDYPCDLTIDNDGNIYVVDSRNSRVQKFTSAGNYLAQLSIPDGVFGIKFSPYNNRLYIVRRYSHYLRNYTLSFSFMWSRNLALSYPHSLGVDSSGNVYIAEYGAGRVSKTDADGNLLTRWTVEAGGNPEDAEPGPNGDVYVSIYNKSKIVIYSSSGTKKGEFFIPSPGEIAIDKMGYVYVASLYGDKIYKFLPDGTEALHFGETGTAPGKLRHPSGIAVTENGDLLVSEGWNNRVCRWVLSSETTTTATAKVMILRKTGSIFNSNNNFRRKVSFPVDIHRPHRTKKIAK